MMKYQFCIRFERDIENTAATKAVEDCNALFAAHGYKDYTLTVWDNSNKVWYYLRLIKELFVFFKALKKGSIVAIQYPLLSINNVFRLFIKIAKMKKVKFFCIIHDLESLRTGGDDKAAVDLEISNLDFFDHIIAHNAVMTEWLRNAGLTTQVTNLEIFDYLIPPQSKKSKTEVHKSIAFAGNLQKSTFIYKLTEMPSWEFNLYGPNFKQGNDKTGNLHWCGSFSPEAIVNELNGAFGLIWDGIAIDCCEGVMGNYLKYNNPHKFSLYLAAGLPVIAPADAAIGKVIEANNLGILISSLHELESLTVSAEVHQQMVANVRIFQKRISEGFYFNKAIRETEDILMKRL